MTTPTLESFLRGWSAAHGDTAPRGVVRAWLSALFPVARALASLKVSPSSLTYLSLVAGIVVPVVVSPGGAWPLVAALFALFSAVIDGLDGAVARVANRQTRWGAILDAVVDRAVEASFGVALVVVGAPWWIVMPAVAVGWLHEYARARANTVGIAGPSVITVAERPTRVIVVLLALAFAGAASGLAGVVVTFFSIAWLVLALVGFVQLLRALRYAL